MEYDLDKLHADINTNLYKLNQDKIYEFIKSDHKINNYFNYNLNYNLNHHDYFLVSPNFKLLFNDKNYEEKYYNNCRKM